jgi:hypothetical protein
MSEIAVEIVINPPPEITIELADLESVTVAVELATGVIAVLSVDDREEVANQVLAELEPDVPFLLLYENAKAGL